jgi:hypothetical protein
MHATYKPPPHPHSPEGNFENGLEQGQSRYKSYLMWLGWVGVNCGWEWETEPLRIPSTRGWGIVGTSSLFGNVFGSTDDSSSSLVEVSGGTGRM